ncbi:NuA4 histone acetyltransferase subunit [Scheffersomyces spartinae]|uniref:Actin-related protein 4 n=1 Tax=Scheffersomyces spartinae TaxID=45513 RepID=A0A9P7V4W8_9ASCO|nr:NuA4 histone acetyltransferase subunit [Scheffersomyces spartinae]KAG7191392.1 NuA4 histone acetyltransferase subunit [Scheffersomyces spartinae]
MATSGNNTAVYGGDEINAIVLDPGSYYSRVGYAGDDFPKLVIESAYGESKDGGKRFYGDRVGLARENYEVKPIIKDLMVTDWDAAVEQYRYCFEEYLQLQYDEQPILITEPVWTQHRYRQKLIETFYEEFDFPALYLARKPTCVSFQQGRANCLVVDIGHDSVSVTPVIDGISLLKNSMKTNYAGAFINDHIEDLISSQYPKLCTDSYYKIRSKTPTTYPEPAQCVYRALPNGGIGVTPLFDTYMKQHLWHEVKEALVEVPDSKLHGGSKNISNSIYNQDQYKRQFQFPAGQYVTFGIERFELADCIFDPVSYSFKNAKYTEKYPPSNGELTLKNTHEDYKPLKRARKAESNQSTPPPLDRLHITGIRGLTELVSSTLSNIDIDLRALTAHNIIVTGGGSLIPQLTDRLYNELSSINPGLKIRLHAVGNASERTNQAWIGGSVLLSLGTFHQMWVSKHEYEEAGPDRILTQRFR